MGKCWWFVLAALLLIWPAVADAVDCSSVPPRPQVDFDSTRVFQFSGGANCWGYIAPDGTEYALMGAQNGIGVVNINTMTVVGTVPAQFCQWRELKTYRHYCYAVSECSSAPNPGMLIIDLGFLPDSVHLVGTYTIPLFNRSHCISIDTAKGFCYLVRNYNGFHILSLANPTAPVLVNSVATPDMHDMTAFNDTVYVAEGNNHSFSIWNVANKAVPVMLARVTIPGGGYVHNIWPTDDRKYIATTEETANMTMKIWNRENLSSIQLVASYLGPSNLAHNAHIEGKYLFLSHYESGVSVLDISTPDCPVEVAKFDTYLASNNPSFNGCWGVYPHTAGRGHVYASNIDGRLFVFNFSVHQLPASAAFSGTPQIGSAPLTVAFSATASNSTAWNWAFGDGGSALVQNPSHAYAPGLYDVQLQVTAPSGGDMQLKTNYITALAETLKVADTTVDPGTALAWDINLTNHVPVTQITVPVTLTNIPALATFDSISIVGCRTENFESLELIHDNRAGGELTFRLIADNGGGTLPLPPGVGPIARMHVTLLPNATPGQKVIFTPPGFGGTTLRALTLTTSFTPAVRAGAAKVAAPPCDCGCHADPICDGQADILDVIETVNVAFRAHAAATDPLCPQERTDVDCSGNTDIIDVTLLINVAFRGDLASSVFCNACRP